jgi:hypothetical protein
MVKKKLRRQSTREDLLIRGTKQVPSEKIDIYSPRRTLQYQPYRSYWLDCVDKLLSADNCFDIEQPGYYKLVCKKMSKKRFNPADFKSLPVSDVQNLEKMFYCSEKVDYDIRSRKIHKEHCSKVKRRTRPRLDITIQEAKFDLGIQDYGKKKKATKKKTGSFLSHVPRYSSSFAEVDHKFSNVGYQNTLNQLKSSPKFSTIDESSEVLQRVTEHKSEAQELSKY